MTRLAWLFVALGACADAQPHATLPTPADPLDAVTWQTATSAISRTLAVLPAEIVAQPSARLTLGPRAEVRLLRWTIQEGDTVTEGDPIAVVSSPELSALSATLVGQRAASATEDARAELGLATTSQAAIAQATLAAAEAHLADARRALSPGRDGWVWRAEATGSIAALTCAVGEVVPADGACVTLVDATRTEVRTRVPERHLPHLGSATGTLVTAAGATFEVTRVRQGAVIDPQSRTLPLWLASVEPSGLVPGQSGRLTLRAPAPEGSVQVPVDAVTRMAGRDVVFLRTPDGPVSVPVEVLGRDGGQVVLTGNDLPADAEIAVSGVFLLKSVATQDAEEAP